MGLYLGLLGSPTAWVTKYGAQTPSCQVQASLLGMLNVPIKRFASQF